MKDKGLKNNEFMILKNILTLLLINFYVLKFYKLMMLYN